MSFVARRLAAPGGPDQIEAVELRESDPADGPVARIAVGAGNTLYYFADARIAGGRNLLHFPWRDLREYRENQELGGNPFLYPWANRLEDPTGFNFRGRRVAFPDSPPVWRDGNGLPLHGCLLKDNHWRMLDLHADAVAAHCSAEQTFDATHPAFACFPFHHRVVMTHRLDRDPAGRVRLTLTTRVLNLGDEALPLTFGYHPYFSFAPFTRDQVRIDLPVTQCFDTDDRLLPTGGVTAVEKLWPAHRDLTLGAYAFDHGFTGLVRNDSESSGTADFQLITPDRRVTVCFGAGYDVAVVYAPVATGADFVCFEPMLGPTNHLGRVGGDAWPALRTLAPGAEFEVTFAIIAEGR